jgi:2-haloacid dehalogenase
MVTTVAGMLIALDVFGTLADPASASAALAQLCGPEAVRVATVWRSKQLEYMFRVTAMGSFPGFSDLTRWALLGALGDVGIDAPSDAALESLADSYRRLQSFGDVLPALADLHRAGHELVAFSVAPRLWLEDLTSEYRTFVPRLVSAEDAGMYKPHPGIYQHLLRTTGTSPSQALLVSSNPFDLIGGGSVGLGTAWCRRDPRVVFDPWGPRPDHTISTLLDLPGLELPV